MKKHFVTIGLFLLLVIFPLISWYYLRTGIDYRKRLLNETRPISHLSSFYSCDTLNFNKNATLINYGNVDSLPVDRLVEQFKKGKGFDIVQSSIDCFVSNDSIKAKDIKMMLIDTSLQVRSIYKNYSDHSIKSLVEHLTIVIPKDEERDIKMK